MADATPVDRFTFRPLARDQLALLLGWLARPHVAPWWDLPNDPESKYFGDERPVHRFIAFLDERAVGMIQMYRWSDMPDAGASIGAMSGEIGIDYLIGEQDLIGRGLGARLIGAFLNEFASGRGDVMGVRAQVDEANRRSWRTLEKLGFVRERSGVVLPGEGRPDYVYVRASGGAGAGADTVAAVSELLRVAAPPSGMTSRILGIDGPGGAGKSALAVQVSRELNNAQIIHTDDFASWENQFGWYTRLIAEVLVPLASGSPGRYQRYDWDLKRLSTWHEVKPSEFLILEGVSATRAALRPYLAATVWVDTSRTKRLRRGLERDGEEARPQWERWMREEDEYVTRERPDQVASLIVSGE